MNFNELTRIVESKGDGYLHRMIGSIEDIEQFVSDNDITFYWNRKGWSDAYGKMQWCSVIVDENLMSHSKTYTILVTGDDKYTNSGLQVLSYKLEEIIEL